MIRRFLLVLYFVLWRDCHHLSFVCGSRGKFDTSQLLSQASHLLRLIGPSTREASNPLYYLPLYLSTSLPTHLLDTNSYQRQIVQTWYNFPQFTTNPPSYEKSTQLHLSNYTNLVQFGNLALPSSANTPFVMVLTNAFVCLPTYQHPSDKLQLRVPFKLYRINTIWFSQFTSIPIYFIQS